MDEWRRGWRTVLGAALAAASGVSLLYLFIAFAPVVPLLFGVMVFVTGLIGVTTTSISYTRAVNGWFNRQRGLALAFSAIGISLTAIFMPPVIERFITLEGWRSGYFLLAGIALLIGLPSILFLVADAPPREAGDDGAEAHRLDTGADPFLRSTAFWLIAVSYVGINMPASGMLSQMAPMMLEEGLSLAQAALGISAYASGQFFGRLACGWLLDRVHPQRTAFFFTLIPAIGCALLWQTQNQPAAALLAVAAIGVQQGAEVDLLAYFVARRFGLDRYGSIYGWVQVAGWIGTLCGILLFGKIHDWTGSYALFQAGAIISYIVAAIAFLFIRLTPQRVFT